MGPRVEAGTPLGGNEEAFAGHSSMLSQSNICLVNKYIVVFCSEEMRRLRRKIMKGLSCATLLGEELDQALAFSLALPLPETLLRISQRRD